MGWHDILETYLILLRQSLKRQNGRAQEICSLASLMLAHRAYFFLWIILCLVSDTKQWYVCSLQNNNSSPAWEIPLEPSRRPWCTCND